jgi:hypothetical protein
MANIKVGRQLVEGSESVRIYHSRVLLSKKRLPIIAGHVQEVSSWAWLVNQRDAMDVGASFRKNDPINAALFSDTSLEEQTHPAVAAILSLEGVEYAMAASYQVVVIKGRQFDWDEIEPSILRVLSTFSLDIESTNKEA